MVFVQSVVLWKVYGRCREYYVLVGVAAAAVRTAVRGLNGMRMMGHNAG